MMQEEYTSTKLQTETEFEVKLLPYRIKTTAKCNINIQNEPGIVPGSLLCKLILISLIFWFT